MDFKSKLSLVWPHLILLAVVAPFDGNQYYASASLIGYHWIFSVAMSLLIVGITVYAAFHLPPYMQKLFLAAVIIFSIMAYVPSLNKVIEEAVQIELPKTKDYVLPDSELRVKSKNEVYLESITAQNKNIDMYNEAERNRVAIINRTRQLNATSTAVMMLINILIFGTLLPYLLYMGAHKLAERLKFIEIIEVKRNVSLSEMQAALLQTSLDLEVAMAKHEEELNKKMEALKEGFINKTLALAENPKAAKDAERSKKAKAVLREFEAYIKADKKIVWLTIAQDCGVDRDTVKRLAKRALHSMPHLREHLTKYGNQLD